jgi:pimeloyl-ACP methyl ester carboxylesterase
MFMKMDFIYTRTKDDLRLMGVHYEPDKKDVAVLFVHGMSGNIIENYFGHVLGKILSQNKTGFIYSHNRGYNHINDIATSEIKKDGGYKTVRIGVNYEVFEDCLLDIESWIKTVKELGYKKIILMGHSLGCNKTIYYLYKRNPKNITGLILASPPDMIGQLKPAHHPNNKALFIEARKNVKHNKQRKILSKPIWNWFNLSSQTFLSLFTKGNNSDNLPIMENPNRWTQLASIKIPIFAFMGEYDDIVINTLKDDLEVIKSKATGAKSFFQKIISKANHVYDQQEQTVAKEVLEWVKNH